MSASEFTLRPPLSAVSMSYGQAEQLGSRGVVEVDAGARGSGLQRRRRDVRRIETPSTSASGVTVVTVGRAPEGVRLL